VTVQVSIPPLRPVAIAGGPYRFCNQATPWNSTAHAPIIRRRAASASSYPGDFITAYKWDLNLDGTYGGSGEPAGVRPDVTSFFSGYAAGSYLVRLIVEDNSKLSFPDFAPNNFVSDPSTATVILEGDCGCITNLSAKVRGTVVDLAWQNIGADSYNIYRKLSTDAVYVKIASTAAIVYTTPA